MLSDALINVCSKGLPDKELIKAIEDVIAKTRPYNHDAANLLDACDIKEADLKKSGTETAGTGTLSAQVELIEEEFPKREIAFLFATQNQMIQQVMHHPIGAMILRKIISEG